MEEKSRRHNARVETQHASTLKRIFGRIIVNVRRFEKKKKKTKREKYSAPVASRICCVSDKSRSGNSQIAKRTGIRIHVDDDGNVNTYTRNDVATRSVGTHLRGSRYAPTRYVHRYVPTKMRIHFLQNVSHSAAHYRRNEKGMMRGGNSDKEDTSRTKKRRRKREAAERGRREKAAK